MARLRLVNVTPNIILGLSFQQIYTYNILMELEHVVYLYFFVVFLKIHIITILDTEIKLNFTTLELSFSWTNINSIVKKKIIFN